MSLKSVSIKSMIIFAGWQGGKVTRAMKVNEKYGKKYGKIPKMRAGCGKREKLGKR